MVDLARALFIVSALVASTRARYLGGVVIAAVCALLLAIETILPFRFPGQLGRIEIAFGSIFLGPTALPHAPPFAASRVLMDPIHHLAAAALAAVGAHRALHRGSSLPPDGASSRAYDGAGLRFIALAVLLGLLSISGVLFHLVGADD